MIRTKTKPRYYNKPQLMVPHSMWKTKSWEFQEEKVRKFDVMLVNYKPKPTLRTILRLPKEQRQKNRKRAGKIFRKVNKGIDAFNRGLDEFSKGVNQLSLNDGKKRDEMHSLVGHNNQRDYSALIGKNKNWVKKKKLKKKLKKDRTPREIMGW